MIVILIRSWWFLGGFWGDFGRSWGCTWFEGHGAQSERCTITILVTHFDRQWRRRLFFINWSSWSAHQALSGPKWRRRCCWHRRGHRQGARSRHTPFPLNVRPQRSLRCKLLTQLYNWLRRQHLGLGPVKPLWGWLTLWSKTLTPQQSSEAFFLLHILGGSPIIIPKVGHGDLVMARKCSTNLGWAQAETSQWKLRWW